MSEFIDFEKERKKLLAIYREKLQKLKELQKITETKRVTEAKNNRTS